MQRQQALSNIDVAILAGGLGTRIRGMTGETPRLLAPIAGRAFLGHLLEYLAQHGAKRVCLSLGHLADGVSAWLAQGDARDDLDVICEIEPRPLGTAGAVRFIRNDLTSDPVLVMSGDGFLDADLRPFVASHRLSGAEASVLCVEVEDAPHRQGVDIGADGRVVRFTGKAPGRRTVSAGVYLFSAAFLDRLAASDAVSLERDVLKKLPRGALHAVVVHGCFIDLGTPDSLSPVPSISAGDGA